MFLFFFFLIIPPAEDNEVENCMAKYSRYVTYLDQSWSLKINNGHVTHLGKQNWPIGGCTVLYATLSLYEIILWHYTHRNSLYKQGKLGRTLKDTVGTTVSGFLVLFTY